MRFQVVLDGNSIEIYIHRFRLELWAKFIEPMSGVVIYVWPAFVLRGSPDYIGIIGTLDWIIFEVGLSLRWLRDGEEV